MEKIIILSILSIYLGAVEFNPNERSLKAGGQIVLDTARFNDDKAFYSNSEIRRARVYIKGEITQSLSYEVEYSFTGSSDWKDVYIKYNGLLAWAFYVGNIREPFGLEALTSSKYNMFMERGLGDFYSSRKIGLMAQSWQKNDDNYFTYALGGYTKSIDNLINNKTGGNSIVSRATYSNVSSKKEIIHVGASLAYTSYDLKTVKLKSHAGSKLYEDSFIKSKVKNVNDTYRLGVESAIVSDSLSFQGEYVTYGIANDFTTYHFNGWYVQLSYFLTGESRKYKPKSAAFSRVKSKNKKGLGALEIVARMTQIDLNDKNKKEDKERDITLGINWYLKSNLRFMADYTYATELKKESKDANIFQARVQYDF